MALDRFWSFDRQFQAAPGPDPRVAAASRAGHRIMGFNEVGQPEAYYVYGEGANTLEYRCDLFLRKMVDDHGNERVHCTEVNLLCPRCTGPLLVHGEHVPGGHTIYLHWDHMTQSTSDMRWRPLISIEGTFGCDYSWSEVNGVAQPSYAARCGWRGNLVMGRMYNAVLYGANGDAVREVGGGRKGPAIVVRDRKPTFDMDEHAVNQLVTNEGKYISAWGPEAAPK